MFGFLVKKAAQHCWSRSYRKFAIRPLTTTATALKWTGGKTAHRLEQKNRNPNSAESDNEAESKRELRNGDNFGKMRSMDKKQMKSPETPEIQKIRPSMRNKFRLFQDETEEVRDSAQAEWVILEAPEEVKVNAFEGLNLERGKTGVFDIEELVEVLRLENADDICVVAIPPEKNFADYMVVVSGRSARQLLGMAQFISQYYKAKKSPADPFLKDNVTKWKSNWICLDLGNIILHLMESEVRETYDIEALWALGPEHDLHSDTPLNQTLQLVEKHSRIVTQNTERGGPLASHVTDPDMFGEIHPPSIKN